MDENNFNQEVKEKREYRKQRRVRNQIIVYISTAVILIGIVVGAFWGIRSMTAKLTAETSPDTGADLNQDVEIIEDPVIVEIPEEINEDPPGEPTEELSVLDMAVEELINQLTLEEKVAGLFFITPEALTDTTRVIRAGETTQERLLEYAVGGLIYSGDNIQSGDQLREMLSNTVAMSKFPIFLGIEEEGGDQVQAAAQNLGEAVDSMAIIGESGDSSQALAAGQTLGNYLFELGFNTNFAPVADLTYEAAEEQILGERAFGDEPALVGRMVSSLVSGMQESGVNACLKYFPGLNGTTGDAATGMVIMDKTLDELRAADFVPFKAGIDAEAAMVMVGNISVPEVVGDNTPASMSEKMINEILRGELGYDGIIITDSLDMGAVTEYFGPGEACIKALQAGADMLLKPQNFIEAYNDVLNAVRDETITEERINESLRRIFRLKCAGQFDDSETENPEEQNPEEQNQEEQNPEE